MIKCQKTAGMQVGALGHREGRASKGRWEDKEKGHWAVELCQAGSVSRLEMRSKPVLPRSPASPGTARSPRESHGALPLGGKE